MGNPESISLYPRTQKLRTIASYPLAPGVGPPGVRQCKDVHIPTLIMEESRENRFLWRGSRGQRPVASPYWYTLPAASAAQR